MKQFDLQAAMRGEPIVTRDGEPVQFIAYVPGADPQQQLVTLRDGVVCVTGIGGIYWGSGSESSRDLFMAPCASHCEAEAGNIEIRNLRVAYERMRTCHKDAQQEIAALQERAQELEQMTLTALLVRSARRVIELEAQLEAAGAALQDAIDLEAQLEAQLEAIGVESLRKRLHQISEPVNAGWCNGCSPDNCAGCVTQR